MIGDLLRGNTMDTKNSNCQRKFSCWDKLDPEWMNIATQSEADRVYVHGKLLLVIVQIINDDILDQHIRATIEEVHHHNLDGPVYLIRFYRSFIRCDRSNMFMFCDKGRIVLKTITNLLRYKIPSKRKLTYFLRIDSDFKNRKDRIISQLQKYQLLDSFETSTLEVNWLYIPKIEIYQFSDNLSKIQIDQIESVFLRWCDSRASLYICNQFDWHKEFNEFVEVDKLGMDICVEEWRRYDLLKDFSVEDILRLDLANKDYRDPDLNKYLDRYLDILLKKTFPQLCADSNTKLGFPLKRFKPYLGHYFVSRFYDKISILNDDIRLSNVLYTLHDLPFSEIFSETVDLKNEQPLPESLLQMKCQNIIYQISNYTHFSDALLKALLNKSNSLQMYNIRFDKNFYFIYEHDQQFFPMTDCNWTFGPKKIGIAMINCNENNADTLVKFIKYLIKLFNGRKKFGVEVSFYFTNCMLDDYTFFENIVNGVDDVHFRTMSFTPQQIKVLSCTLNEQRKIIFSNCKDLTDNDVMLLLKNIDLKNLFIGGINACTPAVYYRMAEHLMNKENVNMIKANRLNAVIKDTKYHCYDEFDLVEFFKDNDKIVVRNHHSKEIVDLYYLLNNILECESLDPSNNMYIE